MEASAGIVRKVNVGNPTSGSLGYDNYNIDPTSRSLVGWHHLLFSAVGSDGGELGKIKVYLDDVDITPPPPIHIGSVPGPNVLNFEGDDSFTVPNVNGNIFSVGGDTFGDNFTGDMADAWIAPGQSLLDGSGDIPTSTRRKFIDSNGKPVDLGSDCSAPTGTAPAICFSGDASTFGTNKGTGGAFALTGTLIDATSSPSN
jgi:hypothetical protein